jgi:hypothetical protein
MLLLLLLLLLVPAWVLRQLRQRHCSSSCHCSPELQLTLIKPHRLWHLSSLLLLLLLLPNGLRCQLLLLLLCSLLARMCSW